MRLFVAVSFSSETKKMLTELQTRLREHGVRGNYTSCDNLHLTLAFIGEYDRPEKVRKALGGVSFEPFELAVGNRTGSFGDLLWVGIERSKELSSLAVRVRAALEAADIPFDHKPFKPHITILRRAVFTNGAISSDLLRTDTVKMSVERISLMESKRINGRLVYSEIK